MDGIFKKARFSNVFNILGIIAGLILIAMTPFFAIVDDEITNETLLGLTAFSVFGLIVVIVCIGSLFFNKGAYLHLSQNDITSRFMWKTKLDCHYSDIAFCEYGINTLNIRMSSGKRYLIPNLINAEIICGEIRKKLDISSEEACFSFDEMLTQLKALKSKRRKWLIFTIVFGAFMFVSIAIIVVMTDGKEISNFTQNQMALFYVFLLFELIDVILTFSFANKCGKLNPLVSEKAALLKKNVLNHAPLPSGNVSKIYMDTDYTAKAIIYGYPNAGDVYFIVQAVDKNFNVITTFESEIFHSIEDLQPLIDELIDIS